MNWKRHMTAVSVALMAGFLMAPAAEKSDRAEVLFESARQKETLEGNLEAAIQQYKEIASSYGSNRAVAAKALVQMGRCYEKLGSTEARKAYERALREFGDQREAAEEARTRLAALEPRAEASHGSAMVTRRLWAGRDVDDEGAPSPDGRYISYVDWETGDLAVRDLLKGEKRRLTNKGPWMESGDFALFSTFSPDGKQVAYAWFTDSSCDLRIVSTAEGAEVSKPRVLFRKDEVTEVEPADWSSDGRHILALFRKKDGTNQIALVSVADGSARILKTLDWRTPQKMSLSPDGRYIAFDFQPRQDSTESDIAVLAADGSRETLLVEHPANDLYPLWTPDGKKIVFASDRTGTMGLWAVPVADGRAQGPADLIKPDIGRLLPMGFTRKGSYFYGLETGMSDIYVATLDLATGKMQAPPSKVTQRFVGANGSPDWSADGRLLAYISNRGPLQFAQSKIICIRSMESGVERELTLKPSLGYFNRPLWSPDGRSLLTSGVDRKGRQGVYQIDPQTGEVKPIVLGEPDVHLSAPVNAPMWSPDGRAILYVQWRPTAKTMRLFRRDLESGQEKEIVRTDAASGIGGWTLSPDGRQIAFLTGDPAKKSMILKIVPADGGESRELLKGQEGIRLVAWTPDSRELIFTKRNSTSPQDLTTELWRMSTTGGKSQRLELAAEQLGGLRFHPDGQRIAFSAGTYKAEIWVMENFLPGLMAAK